MIYILDDFLPKSILNALVEDKDPFKKYTVEKQEFYMKPASNNFSNYVVEKIEKQEGKKIKNILSFFREASPEQNTNWGIHNDSVIFDEQPDRAVVLFIQANEEGLNGTAFWEHKEQGEVYTGNANEEFYDLIQKDYDNRDMWNLKSVVGYKQNRLLSYPSNYFHSKFPNKFENSRKVFVMFYKHID